MASAAGRAKTVDVPEGGALVDICDRFYAPVPFSCRSATCATCHVIVEEGEALLEPPEHEETDLLRLVRAPPHSRPACQAVVKAEPGLLRVRPYEG